MKVAAFLPAKGASRRIPSKNTMLLDGEPLFLRTLSKLVAMPTLAEVYLDTDSDDLAALASDVGCRRLTRPGELATNKADGNALMVWEASQTDADICLQVLCTGPFLRRSTIERAVGILAHDDRYDSVVAVTRQKQYRWAHGRPGYDIEHIPNSVDLPDTIAETMGLYVITREAALKTGRRVGDHPAMIEASPLEAFDVNWPEDFEMANLIAAGMREKDRYLLANIKNHLNSCLLSDLLDDLGHTNQIVRGLAPNIANAKFLGRAKTLKLRLLEEGEDFRGIYSALHSYKEIVPNDIIVVENESPDYAYFGELNANLAIRSGASAVVVGGKTRDSVEVQRIGLPVFAAGYSCQDVRKRATVAHMNKKIQLDGVSISPGDLVFGDAEGVVVIPSQIEKQVLDEVYRRISNEKRILVDISLGVGVDSLVSDYGFF
jgi:regulator of RNase E activity RraA/CMP-N-acetylneuraminic acid synthetase